MRYCPKCGAENEEEATHCTECGFPMKVENRIRRRERIDPFDNILVASCPECGHNIQYRVRLYRPNWRCPECGKEFEIPEPKEVKWMKMDQKLIQIGIWLPVGCLVYFLMILPKYPINPILGIPLGMGISYVFFTIIWKLGILRH